MDISKNRRAFSDGLMDIAPIERSGSFTGRQTMLSAAEQLLREISAEDSTTSRL